jgi:hypothetical protein
LRLRQLGVLSALSWAALGCQPPVEAGCEGAEFVALEGEGAVAVPAGVRRFDRFGMNVEIWYPGVPGSEAGKDPHVYDLRRYLPPEEAAKVSDAQNPWQPCPCYDGLPLDTRRGPYPVIVFIHGTAGYAAQSAQLTAYWASQGFVVIAMDHPGIYLTDLLALNMAPRQADDVRELLADLRAFRGGFAELEGAVDLQRIAITGHSAGGYASGELGDEQGVQLLMPMAAGGTSAAGPMSLILGAVDDQVVPYADAESGYEQTPGEKLLVGLNNAGHLAFSDLCAMGSDQGGLVVILQETGISIPDAAGDLVERLGTDGCAEGQMSPERGWAITQAVTGSYLSARLQCRGEEMSAEAIAAAFGDDVTVRAP